MEFTKIIKGVFILFICLSFNSCKEYEKKKILAQEAALEEIKAEREKESTDAFMAQIENQNKENDKLTIAEGETTSRGQSYIMEKDLKFKFSSDNSIGFDYVVIGKKKFTLDDEKSEANGKYMLYKEAKILGTDGIVNYKMRLVGSSKFSVEGTFVKKK